MEKVRKLLLSSLCLLSLLPASGCKDKIVVNNAFVYLVHESCYSYGHIGILVDGEPVYYTQDNYYQWQSVLVGEYSQEVVAIPNPGYKFIVWSDGCKEVLRKDLATNENDNGPVVFYAFFEVVDE